MQNLIGVEIKTVTTTTPLYIIKQIIQNENQRQEEAATVCETRIIQRQRPRKLIKLDTAASFLHHSGQPSLPGRDTNKMMPTNSDCS